MDEFKQRFSAAKAQRRLFEVSAREIYKFCFNGREAEWDKATSPDYEPEEIFTDFPATVGEDFAGELFSTMTPENAPWVEYEVGNAVPEDSVDEVKTEVRDLEETMAKSIRASNYYTEGHTIFQDAIVGNVAMWVDRPAFGKSITCEAIPLPELYLRIGPFGIADRFRQRSYFTRDLEALFPGAEWPQKLKDKIKNAKNGRSEVTWGFWPNYKDPVAPTWERQIRVDGESIGLDKNVGEEGATEIVVGRFNAVANSPWGWGPGRRMLPTMRVLDTVSSMTLEGMERELDPAIIYPNDGMLDLSDGIESGLGYPAYPGSSENIRELGVGRNLDYGYYSQEQLESQLRDGFYREVEQRGKTPPSASQFIGQEQKQLRRIARPAAKTWGEFGVGLLKRFEYLERQKGGLLQDFDLPMIDEGLISVRPISPLERAQAREDVLVAQSVLDMAQQSMGPEQAAIWVDGPKTMTNIKGKLKDKLVEFRDEEQAMQIFNAMQGGTDAPQE